MVYLPVSHLGRRHRRREPSFLSGLISIAADFLRMLGAATRVAAAVEARREPARTDLRILGIPGKLPPLL